MKVRNVKRTAKISSRGSKIQKICGFIDRTSNFTEFFYVPLWKPSLHFKIEKVICEDNIDTTNDAIDPNNPDTETTESLRYLGN